EAHRPGRHAHMRLWQQAHHSGGRQRLARSTLAHETDDFPRIHAEIQAVDRQRPVRAFRQRDPQSLDLEYGACRLLLAHDFFWRGFTASLRPSPIRLKASTVTMIAMPGMATQ